MRIQWNEQSFRWFEAAADYTGFPQRLVALLLPHMPRRGTLVDLGCGAGMVDLALAGDVGEITCVDNNADVLDLLDATLQARHITNIATRLADAATLDGLWDTVLMTFYGRFADHISHYLSLCREAVIAVVHANAHGHANDPLDTALPKDFALDTTAAALDAMGVRYTQEIHSLEYGQPFQTREDAAAFIDAYGKRPPDMAMDAYLSRRLMETRDKRYPLYMPHLKRFGIFVVRRSENAHL